MRIYEKSVKSIADVKNLEDKLKFKLSTLGNTADELAATNLAMQTQMATNLAERDKAVKELRELQSIKGKSDFKYVTALAAFKERLEVTETRLRDKNNEYNDLYDVHYSKDKQLKVMMLEREKMKARIIMLKKKKGNF